MKNLILLTTTILFVGLNSSADAQWFPQNNPSQNTSLHDIIALDENTAIAVGFLGTILKTTDGGDNWLSVSTDTMDWFNSVYFVNEDNGWIAESEFGDMVSSKILKTTDGGNNWASVSPIPGTVNSVHFVDQNTGWVVGIYSWGDSWPRGIMYKTTDGGINWNQEYGATSLLNFVCFISQDIGWVGGSHSWYGGWSDSTIFKTTDGGITWITQTPDSISCTSGYFIDQNTGWVAGYQWNGSTSQGVILKTIDGGENWISQLVEVNNTLYDIYFIDENIGWAVGTEGNILKTMDGGENWISQPSGTSNNLYSVHFADDNTGWVVGENGTILKTTNGGGTVPVELTSFTATAQSNYVELNWSTATETNNMMFEIERASSSTTPVQDWRMIGFVEGKGTTTERQEYSYIDRDVATGKYFYRLKQIDFDGRFEYSSEIEVDAAPVSFSLEQNYPNPFNPSTKITYSIPHKSFVSLKVFDQLGSKVAELVQEEKEAGRYEIDFSANGGSASGGNASGLSSGVYFYKISVVPMAQRDLVFKDGQAGDPSTGSGQAFIKTKKMILLR